MSFHHTLSEIRKWVAAPYLLGSAALLVPCFWLPRIYACDLSSHLYNAWLAQLLEAKPTQGLVLVNQFTNTLFDRVLSFLFRYAGELAAERISVAAAVLIFGWGAFAFIAAVSRSRPWRIFPCVLMLAYGWVFHMGFFNFYVSLGLCLWALSLAWRPTPKRIAGASALAVLAWMAHALPVGWALGVIVYASVARQVLPRTRLWLLAAAVGCVVLLRFFLVARTATAWSPRQILSMLGVDQLWVFGPVFLALAFALLAVLALPVLRLTDREPLWDLAAGIPAQLCVLTAAGIAIVPTRIELPEYKHALVYISDRMSLAVALCLCAFLASAPWRKWETRALVAIAVAYFGFAYADQREIGLFEQQMERAVQSLPPGSRVASAIEDSNSRVSALTHAIDRACIGHCFSYGNYEPSTWQFRVRATGPNPIVASEYEDSLNLQVGGYKVQERDRPFFELVPCGPGARLCAHEVKPGERTRSLPVRLLPF